MSDVVIAAIIGSGGVVLGVLFTWVCSLISDYLNNKRENKRAKLSIEIETYSDAIRYIGVYSRLKQNERNGSSGADNQEVLSELRKEEVLLYNKFHPIFSLIASEGVVVSYNKLREDIQSGIYNQAEAYQKVIQILNFNIADKHKEVGIFNRVIRKIKGGSHCPVK